MPMELGVVLDVENGAGHADAAEKLALAADANGLDLVVVPSDRSGDAHALDTWTTAVWLAARTSRIAVGVSQRSDSPPTRGAAFGVSNGPPHAASTLPRMRARARESLEVLAPGRLVAEGGDVGASAWRTAPRDVTAADSTFKSVPGNSTRCNYEPNLRPTFRRLS